MRNGLNILGKAIWDLHKIVTMKVIVVTQYIMHKRVICCCFKSCLERIRVPNMSQQLFLKQNQVFGVISKGG